MNSSGDIWTCCKITPSLSKFKNKSSFNLKEDSLNDYWNSDYRNHVKDQFLKGDVPPECARCLRDEKQNIKSERQFANQNYGIVGNKPAEYYLKRLEKENLKHPEDYNLDITNLCNLKCQMCSGESSSKLLIENNALGIQNLDQKDYDVSDEKLQKLISDIVGNNVTNVTLQGGEPLMNPKIILLLKKLSTKDLASSMSVWITTNGTQHTEKLHDVLSKFKEVKLTFSIDGVGRTNDYLRYPSNWAGIENNVKKFKKLNNATHQISFTVQNLNLLDIANMIKFSNKNKIHLKLNLLFAPGYLQLHVLTKKILKKALDNLETVDHVDTIHVTNFDTIKEKIQSALQDNKLTHNELSTLKEIIFKRDSYRKIHIKDYLPEIVEGLNI